MKRVVLLLPFPPTVNHYWKPRLRGKKFSGFRVTGDGKVYRERVKQAVLMSGLGIGERPLFDKGDRIAVVVNVFAADYRRRDLDNLGKALLDSLATRWKKGTKEIEWGGVYYDDAQIDDLRFVRGAKVATHKAPFVEVTIQPAFEELPEVPAHEQEIRRLQAEIDRLRRAQKETAHGSANFSDLVRDRLKSDE